MTRRTSVRRAAPAREAASVVGPRRRRGSPEDTRQRLLAMAAEQFERSGFSGTDTNRIARAAGYAPGTFYKHFSDKLEVFLAVYDAWIADQWDVIAKIAADGRDPRDKAERVAAAVLEHHRTWRGLRASVRQLVETEARVRRAYRASRLRQLALMRDLGLENDLANAILLFEVERIADAIATGEVRELGLPEAAVVGHLIDRIERHLAGQ